MIKVVREYVSTKYANAEKQWDVIHETNGKRRWFYYYESGGGLPKTAQKFMEGKTPIPYNDDTFHERGYIYQED